VWPPAPHAELPGAEHGTRHVPGSTDQLTHRVFIRGSRHRIAAIVGAGVVVLAAAVLAAGFAFGGQVPTIPDRVSWARPAWTLIRAAVTDAVAGVRCRYEPVVLRDGGHRIEDCAAPTTRVFGSASAAVTPVLRTGPEAHRPGTSTAGRTLHHCAPTPAAATPLVTHDV